MAHLHAFNFISKIRIEKASLEFGFKIYRYILNLLCGVSDSIYKLHNIANCFLPPVLYKSPIKQHIIWRCSWQAVFHAIMLSCRDFSVYRLLWLLQFFSNCAPQPNPFFSSFILHHTCSSLFMNLWMISPVFNSETAQTLFSKIYLHPISLFWLGLCKFMIYDPNKSSCNATKSVQKFQGINI